MLPLPIRRAVAADAAAIRDLSRAAYAKWVPLIGREPWPMTADYDRAVREHLIDLCEEEGALLALAEMIAEPGHLLLENLAVRPECQGRGLGALLLGHVERVAVELRLPEVRLYTNAAYAQNLAFYAGRGYRAFLSEPIATGGLRVHLHKAV